MTLSVSAKSESIQRNVPVKSGNVLIPATDPRYAVMLAQSLLPEKLRGLSSSNPDCCRAFSRVSD